MSRRKAGMGAGIFFALSSVGAAAQHTETYAYDEHGRLSGVSRASGATSQTTTYALDKADNRTVRNTGAPTAGPAAADPARESPLEDDAVPATDALAGSHPDRQLETSDKPDAGAHT